MTKVTAGEPGEGSGQVAEGPGAREERMPQATRGLGHISKTVGSSKIIEDAEVPKVVKASHPF